MNLFRGAHQLRDVSAERQRAWKEMRAAAAEEMLPSFSSSRELGQPCVMRQRASGNGIDIVGVLGRVSSVLLVLRCSSSSPLISVFYKPLWSYWSVLQVLPSGIDIRYLSQRLASLRSAASLHWWRIFIRSLFHCKLVNLPIRSSRVSKQLLELSVGTLPYCHGGNPHLSHTTQQRQGRTPIVVQPLIKSDPVAVPAVQHSWSAPIG